MARRAGPMLVLVLVQLATLAVAVASGQQLEEPCERLLADYGELTRFGCRCSDAMPADSMLSSTAASQLHCNPNTLAEFIVAAPTLTVVAGNSHQVGQLSINTRLGKRREPATVKPATKQPLAIDHISLELIGQVASPKELEEQMMDLVGLINATHLQFLSILLHQNRAAIESEEEEEEPDNFELINVDTEEIKLTHLLAKLPALARLELSLVGRLNLGSSPLLLPPTTLKWLSVGASGGSQVLLMLPDRLAPTFAELEHLSLETNGGGGESLEELALATRFAGLTKLGSLNLANNRLASFQKLLFGPTSGRRRPNEETQWPALNQLDLSHNRFALLEHKAAQFILQSMPNLQQLYLQHNHLLQLNLNSLLRTPLPKTIVLVGSVASELRQTSSLEYLDLSHNRLAAVIGMQTANSSHGRQELLPRIKSINLAHNQLSTVLVPVDSFTASKLEHNSSELVDFDMSNRNLSSSLCDFLSPPSPHQSANEQQQDLLNEVLLQNNRLHQIWGRDFAGSACRDVQIVRLSSNYIATIEANAFYSLTQLEHLDLSHNLLAKLEEETFAKSLRLRILNLSYNRLIDIAKGSFSQLSQLEELLLNDNELREFPASLLESNQQLLVLDLSNNKLASLERSMFAPLKRLQVLNLNSNRLLRFTHQLFALVQSSLPKSSIVTQAQPKSASTTRQQTPNQTQRQMSRRPTGGKMEREKQARKRQKRDIGAGNNLLILTGNQLEHFQVDECQSFVQNVQFLWLNSNKLKSLAANQFKCFQSLQRLHLGQNLISQLDGKALGGSGGVGGRHLEYIDFSGNQLVEVPLGSFAQLTNLRHLDLSSNRLISFSFSLVLLKSNPIQRKAPAETTQIESINLSGNQLLQLDALDLLLFLDSTCDSSSKLTLRLANIEAIIKPDNNRTTSCLNVDLLDLSNIKRLVELPFHNTSSIARLDLSGTKYGLDSVLRLLERTNDDELVSLSLNGNNYNQTDAVKLVENIQHNHNQMSHLSLSNNRIQRWPFRHFSNAHHQSKLISLDMSSNNLEQFIAATEGPTTKDHYEFRELELLNLSSNALMGLVEQQNLATIGLRLLMPQLKTLDLSHNRLAWLPLHFLDGLRHLEHLRLDHNQLEQILVPIRVGPSFHLDLSHNQRGSSMESNEVKESFAPSERLDLDNLIIFDGAMRSSNYSGQSELIFRCQSIDQFVSYNEDHFERRGTEENQPDEVAQTTRSYQQQQQDEEAETNDRCRRLMELSQFLRLGSNQMDSFRSISLTRYTFLNSRRSSLRAQDLHFARARHIIQLDLSWNQVNHLPSHFCTQLSELKSLDLSNNQLSEFPESVILCPELAYLDLSHNQIASWPTAVPSLGTSQSPSQLAVVKLNHNSLTELRHQMLASLLETLPALRYLDLRSNWGLKVPGTLRWWRPLPFIIRGQWEPSMIVSPHLEASKESLLINATSFLFADKQQQHNRGQIQLARVSHRVLQSTNKRFFELDTNKPIHHIKFCTLPNQTLTQVCLEMADQPDRCVKLRRPPEVGSCVTDLAGQKYDSSQLIGVAVVPGQDQDLVLNFIDCLKRYWLLLKETNVNELLASVSHVHSDQVLAQLGAYPIYSLTMVKAAIVGGALAIICLLVSMFTLLANQDSPTADGHRDSTKNDETANETTNNSSSSSSSSSSNSDQTNNTQISANTGATSGGSSLSASNNNSAPTPETVVERQKNQASQNLDAGQLLFQQHQCPTPSSSLAPSSVETAETLQAVESIQSGNNSADLYGNYHQQQQQQVATVMRMVKSSSANFDSATRRLPATYGTLGNAHGSHNLRSRMRALERQSIYPSESFYHPASQYSAYSAAYVPVYVTTEESTSSSPPPPPPPPLELQDSAQTLASLGGLNTSASQQVAPNVAAAVAATNSNQPAPLCQYHRFQQQQANDNVILEENLNQLERCSQMELLPPPPPASRVIEALENPLLFLGTHQQHPSQLNHHHHRHYH